MKFGKVTQQDAVYIGDHLSVCGIINVPEENTVNIMLLFDRPQRPQVYSFEIVLVFLTQDQRVLLNQVPLRNVICYSTALAVFCGTAGWRIELHPGPAPRRMFCLDVQQESSQKKAGREIFAQQAIITIYLYWFE